MSGKRAGPWLLPVTVETDIFRKAQTGAIGLTTAIAATQGLFRISLSLCILVAGTAGQLTLSIIGTNSAGATVTQSLAAVSVTTAGNATADTFVFEWPVTAGVLQYQVTATGLTAGSLSYTARVVVEKVSATT